MTVVDVDTVLHELFVQVVTFSVELVAAEAAAVAGVATVVVFLVCTVAVPWEKGMQTVTPFT